MLAQHDWQDPNRKRGREDEYQDIAVGGTLGFTEHRSKRVQALPLRLSDSLRRWPGPPTLPTGQHNLLGQSAPHTVTPSDSESEDANPNTYHHDLQNRPQSFQDNLVPRSPPTFYMEPEIGDGEDMDMMMDGPEPGAPFTGQQEQGQQQIDKGDHLQPGCSQPDSIGPSTITGRMPTPIQPSFAAQVRGKNWSGAAGSLMGAPPAQHIPGNTSDTRNDFATSQLQVTDYHGSGLGASFPRSVDDVMVATGGQPVTADWGMVQNRRLPSPISENGGEGEDGQISSGMIMDSTSVAHSHHDQQGSFLPRSSSAMEMGASSPAVNVPPRVATPHVIVTGGGDNSPGNGDGSMEVEGVTPSPPRKGHSRSRHTVNNWTLQPGMKKSFSIGYRADCEKCRLKVPGHFNHIIIS